MFKRYFFAISLVWSVFCGAVYAQQDSHYTGYQFNPLVINPAYAGSRGVPGVLAYYRHQWVNINTAPQTGALSFQMPMRQGKMGVGAHIESDWIGVHNRISLFGDYAYRLRFQRGTLALGLQAGLLYYRSNFSQVDIIDNLDPVYAQDQTRLLPNFGTGIYYHNRRMFLGLSVPHLLNNDLSEVDARQSRHYFLSGGYTFAVADNILLRPTFMLKYVANAPLSADVDLMLILKQRFWIGGAYRWKESVDLLLQYQSSPKLRFGYAYDYPLTPLSNIYGSHEIFIGYEWGFSEDRILTPRYF